MHRPDPMPWETRPAATGRRVCYFCAQVRPLDDLRSVHVAGRITAVYACRLGLAPDYCYRWQECATREGVAPTIGEPSA